LNGYKYTEKGEKIPDFGVKERFSLTSRWGGLFGGGYYFVSANTLCLAETWS